jgi:multicomponent Na+:H+ antiporter subunit C
MIDYFVARGPYVLFVVLIMCGVYMLVARRNYLKMIAGLYLFQSAIILFFILVAARRDGTVPILGDESGMQANPLPHALMLTAIVVGVATLGVALAILRRMHGETGRIEETTDAPAEQDTCPTHY